MRGSIMTVVAVLLLVPRLLWGQERATGLILATQEQLRGVPLADTPFSGTALPDKIDLTASMPPAGDQGRQNSCVAWSIAYALKSFQEKEEERWDLQAGSGQPNYDHIFSPAFIYNQINHGHDGGSLFVDALAVLSEQGACTWSDMPYNVADFQSQPSAVAKARARRYSINTWRRVNVQDPKEVKAQLNAHYPVIIGATVDDGFMRLGPNDVWRQVKGQQRGGHAMLLVGYDDSRSAFRVMNSWGGQWGDHGYGWIDYGFFRTVVNEGYVAKDAKNGADPNQPTVTPQPNDPNRPVQPPVPKASIVLTGVQHNVQVNGVVYMVLEGTLDVPPGSGDYFQVAIHFFWQQAGGAKGNLVGGTTQGYIDVNGFAATGNPAAWVPPTGIRTTWQCWMPYQALALGIGWFQTPQGPRYIRGNANLLAETTLFVNNFGVSTAQPVPFGVNYP